MKTRPQWRLRDVSGWTIEDLDLTQIGQAPQPLEPGNKSGKDLDPNSDRKMKAVVDVRALGPAGVRACGGSCTVSDIKLEDLVVHDGQWNGIYIGAGYQNPDENTFGYVNRLLIQDVESRGNQSSGIAMAGTFTKNVSYELTNVRVLDSFLYDNGGDGLMVGQVDHGLIQGNRCAYNGRIRNASIGCWSWDSKGVTIQFNEADHNMTPLTNSNASDGGGFDLDMGSVDSVMQYNWSYDNQGEGYLVESWPIGYGFKCCISRNITVRYNISERDGQKDAGGISIYGGVRSAWIYNNTVYYVASRRSSDSMFGTGGDFVSTTDQEKAGLPDVDVFNNLFISDGTLHPSAVDTEVDTDGHGRFTFDHNIWDRVEGGVRFQWGKSDLTDWSGWQGLGFDVHGDNADPLVTGPLGSGPTGYQLRSGSPAIGAAADLMGSPKGMGGRDYFGASIPQAGRYDIGAAEYSGSYRTQQSNALPVSHEVFTPSSHVASFSVTNMSSGADHDLQERHNRVLERESYQCRRLSRLRGHGDDDRVQPVVGLDLRHGHCHHRLQWDGALQSHDRRQRSCRRLLHLPVGGGVAVVVDLLRLLAEHGVDGWFHAALTRPELFGNCRRLNDLNDILLGGAPRRRDPGPRGPPGGPAPCSSPGGRGTSAAPAVAILFPDLRSGRSPAVSIRRGRV